MSPEERLGFHQEHRGACCPPDWPSPGLGGWALEVVGVVRQELHLAVTTGGWIQRIALSRHQEIRALDALHHWVKYTPLGFRNKQDFIHAIYFHCGGPDLAPEATESSGAPTLKYLFSEIPARIELS